MCVPHQRASFAPPSSCPTNSSELRVPVQPPPSDPGHKRTQRQSLRAKPCPRPPSLRPRWLPASMPRSWCLLRMPISGAVLLWLQRDLQRYIRQPLRLAISRFSYSLQIFVLIKGPFPVACFPSAHPAFFIPRQVYFPF